METAIAADDMKIFDEARALHFDLKTDFIIVGNKGRCKIYEALIKAKLGTESKFTSVTERDDIDTLAVLGAAEIAKRTAEITQLANK